MAGSTLISIVHGNGEVLEEIRLGMDAEQLKQADMRE